MDSTELNKIAAAILCAVVAFGVADWAGAALAPDRRPTRPAFPIAGLAPGGGASASGRVPIGIRLASASPSRGEVAAGNLCASCHSFDKDGPAIVGPNLYDVAGGRVASVDGYTYSDALKQVGGRWTPDRLDAWLHRPQAFAPGTRMGFAGIPDDADRADVVAYLVSLSTPTATHAPPAIPSSAASPAGAGAEFATLVAGADVKAGATAAADSCDGCHSFDQGGSAMIGPNLYGVFGRGIGQGADYSYSAALSGHHGNWTVATLDAWLTKPRAFAPGTKMAFPGIADDHARAAVIAYLRSLSDKT